MRQRAAKRNGWFLLALAVVFLLAPGAMQAQGYHDFAAMRQALRDVAKAHPNLVRVESLVRTAGGKEVLAAIVSVGDDRRKPAVLVVGGVEGADLAGSELCLQFVRHLAESYGRVDSVTRILDRVAYYVFPRVNPDAAEAYFARPQYERNLNARATDLDRDGRVDEDGYDDLNGDGVITQMRVEDPAGEWIPDSEFPFLLRKADRASGEQGRYLLYSEGRDNDGDGAFNEDEPGGVDFNRNFTFNYKFFSRGAGIHQVSEAETRAVADFAFDHPNILMVFSFSPNDNLMQPWKPSASRRTTSSPQGARQRRDRRVTSVLPQDAPIFNHVSELFKKLTGFKDAPPAQKGEGAFCEWAYYHYGRWSFSTRAWWPPVVKEKPDTSSAKNRGKAAARARRSPASRTAGGKTKDALAQEKRLWKWLKSIGREDAFVPWRKISHPDFPDKTVEVGGFKPFVKWNPPADSLTALAEKFNRFLDWLGTLAPRLEIAETRVEALHDRAFRITVKLVNGGYLPTNSAMGDRARWPRNVKASLELSKDQVLTSGRKVQILKPISGMGGNAELSWVVVGKPGEAVTLTLESPICGRLSQKIVLRASR